MSKIALLLVCAFVLVGCGTPELTVLTYEPNACAFTQRATCKMGAVQVDTELPPGTELSRPECDSVCLSVNCAGEAKKCTVQIDSQTQDRVVLCEPMGC